MWPPSVIGTTNAGNQSVGRSSSEPGFCTLPPAISGRWNTLDHRDSASRLEKGLLADQQEKFTRDWTRVSTIIPGADKERYLYNWLIVNTRTFYHEIPGRKKKKKIAREDCMALVPFADYFNHADEGVGKYSSPFPTGCDAEREI